MRIVGGIWRGRSFAAPEGRETRPTTDRMRESIASMILSEFDLNLDDCSVLDAFAGSGGMGLELLSRGARHCTFCEKDRKTAALIRRNCKALGASSTMASVVVGDVGRLCLASAVEGAPFSLVFLDPPYAMPADDVAQVIQGLADAGMLSPSCVLMYERSKNGDELKLEGFFLVRSKRHGGTCIDLLRRGDANE